MDRDDPLHSASMDDLTIFDYDKCCVHGLFVQGVVLTSVACRSDNLTASGVEEAKCRTGIATFVEYFCFYFGLPRGTDNSDVSKEVDLNTDFCLFKA